MLPEWLLWICFGLYALAASLLAIYGLNAYVLLALFGRKVRSLRAAQTARRQQYLSQAKQLGEQAAWPLVTTQIPLYNEYNVARRVIEAVAAFEYPENRHQIQVVDDSTDETRELVAELVTELQAKGVWIEHCRREGREGYKAGGLKAAMEQAKGEFIAIFDSDFVPQADFLRQLMPLFKEENTALVQARWGHLNPEMSLLTRAQSFGIDGHFVVEQVARSANGLFLNFNGTAGIWRKAAILDAGNWQADTLTEDLDLSYRAQLKGWKIEYALDVAVPAELPESYAAFKSQQFRWAKGSIQTAKKLLWPVLRSRASLLAKAQACFHLLHYALHFCMLLIVVLALPLSQFFAHFGELMGALWLIIPMLLATFGPSILYGLTQRYLHPKSWGTVLLYLPGMMVIGFGICLSNARAVLEGLFGVKSGFVRTPKSGQQELKSYAAKPKGKGNGWAALELLAAAYAAFTTLVYLLQGTVGGAPFFLIFAVGFGLMGVNSLRARSTGS